MDNKFILDTEFEVLVNNQVERYRKLKKKNELGAQERDPRRYRFMIISK